jgi:ribose transport system permease protein
MQSRTAMPAEITAPRTAWRPSIREAGTVLGLVVIVVVFSILSPFFLTTRNLIEVLQQSSINACIAVGMTLVIVTGGIDLSVGSTAALAAVIGGALMVAHVPIALALLLVVAIGAGAGAVNGALVAFAGLQPFIVTLGTLSLYRAFALIFTGGNPILGIPDEFRDIVTSRIGGVPTPVILVAVIAALGWIVLRLTPLGEWLLALGGNEEAARVSGVPIRMTKIAAYMISGALAAIAALILVAWLGAADPTLGNLWELQAIAAAAIGGASLLGGKGSIVGSVIGAIILGAMNDGLTLLNVQAFYQLLATGVIIIAAMLIDRLARGRE